MRSASVEGLKGLLQRGAPGPYTALRGVWHRHWVRGFERRLRRITDALIRRYGLQVIEGPFAGMQYPAPSAVGSMLAPKLLGSYEAELHPVIGRAIAANYPVIVNVGCAEGYYAIGLALRLPEARVYAFDTNPLARQLCEKMARVNGVADRVVIESFCDAARLNALPLDGAFLICDVDGYETELLRPDLVPGLAACDVLVELHDDYCRDPSITPTIRSRFAPTHEIVILAPQTRDAADYPAVGFLPVQDQKLAIDEVRCLTPWAFMTSRDPSASSVPFAGGNHEGA